MAPTVFKTTPSTEFLIPEGCHIIEIMNQHGIDFSIARARVEPGVTTALHQVRATTEAYYILEGAGTVQSGNELKANVGVGNVVLFPPGVLQTITNTSNVDLIFLAICSPRFVQNAYVQVEDMQSG